MPSSSLSATLPLILDLLRPAARGEHDKALEIAVLRHQWRPCERTGTRKPRLSRRDEVVLAALVAKCRDLSRALVLVQPATVRRWHREIARRKRTSNTAPRRDRPATPAATAELIERLVREDRAGGHGKSQGELLTLGHRASESALERVLRRHRLAPAPERGRRTWRDFLRATATPWSLATPSPSTRSSCSGCVCSSSSSARGASTWSAAAPRRTSPGSPGRHASPLGGCRMVRTGPCASSIRDRDGKFPASFDAIFASEGIAIVKTPPQTPNASAVAERVVRTIRAACLDHPLIVNEAHLRSVLRRHAAYYNHRRPHQGRDQGSPLPLTAAPTVPTPPRRSGADQSSAAPSTTTTSPPEADEAMPRAGSWRSCPRGSGRRAGRGRTRRSG